MRQTILLTALVLALTLAACSPARSEAPESAGSSQPDAVESSLPESSGGPESSSEPLPPEPDSGPAGEESQEPRTLPDWIDEAFYPAANDWGWEKQTSDWLLERYGDLVISDRYFILSAGDGTLSGWVQLAPGETVPETVPAEEFYRNQERLEQFRENCQAGNPDQLVLLSRGGVLLYGLQVCTFDGETLWVESLWRSGADRLASGGLAEAEIVEGDGWWQIRRTEGGTGILIPTRTLARSVPDRESMLRQAEEAGCLIEEEPADRNGIPCTHYFLWNEQRNVLYASVYLAEDGSCWFYGDEVNGATQLALEDSVPFRP